MFKYLAGIFAKPDNHYVDGRLATPLTPISPSKKVSLGSHTQQCVQMKRSMLTCSETEVKRSRKGSHSQVPGQSTRQLKVHQVLEPDSYIVKVQASSSSNDVEEPKPPRKISIDCNRNPSLKECRSSFLRSQIPGPPPASRVQSWMSLQVDVGAINWKQLSYASDEDLEFYSLESSNSKTKTNDW
ncbi:hypothetical protein KR059_000540, partial [Drosophila kikkawai]